MSPPEELPAYLESYLAQQEEASPARASAEEARPGEWRNLWTWIEHHEGEVLPACLEILGRAREIADELGTRNGAVLFGHRVDEAAVRLGEQGADRVYVVDAPEYAEFSLYPAREALTRLVAERRPEAVLFPATIQGRNLGAQVAAALGAGIVPNCNALTLDATERLLIGHQTSFEERLLSDVVCPVERPQLFTVTPGSYRRPAPERGREAQVIPIAAPDPVPPSRIRFLAPEPDRHRSLEYYDAVVAAGLGVASKEAFDLALQLAKELDAYAGATRGAVACGWAAQDRLITSTRHRLRPRLYVACGVVGEYDHLKAVEEAHYVVALTDDPTVPITENADLIGIGDPAELLRRLLQDLRKAKEDRFTISPQSSRT